MKVLFISDIHIGYETKGMWETTWGWQKPALERFLEVIRTTEDLEAVFMCGDLVDSSGPMPAGVAKAVTWFGEELANVCRQAGVKAFCIPGNHDCVNHQTDVQPNWVSNLWGNRWRNLEVIDEPITLTVAKNTWAVFPWMPDFNEFKRQLATIEATFIVGHSDAQGFRYAPKTIKCTNGIDEITVKRFKQVFLGHFHMQQTIGNVTYVGNPYPLNLGDLNSQRGYMIYDVENDLIEHKSLDADPFVVLEFENRIYSEDELAQYTSKVVYLTMTNPNPLLRRDIRQQLAKVTSAYHERVDMTSKQVQTDVGEVIVENDDGSALALTEEEIVRQLAEPSVDSEAVLAKYLSIRS